MEGKDRDCPNGHTFTTTGMTKDLCLRLSSTASAFLWATNLFEGLFKIFFNEGCTLLYFNDILDMSTCECRSVL